MRGIFDLVYAFLLWVATLTGLTYEEVNVIAYYVLIPSVFLFLIDRITKWNLLALGYLLGFFTFAIQLPDFRAFSKDLFDCSVRFLQSFDSFGWDYTAASVIICVVVPGITLLILCYYAFPQMFGRKAAGNRLSA